MPQEQQHDQQQHDQQQRTVAEELYGGDGHPSAGVRAFTAADGDRALLQGSRVTVAGYGHLGRSVALNLRDSGVAVVVGNVDDPRRELAEAEGFEVCDLASATGDGDLVWVLLPDEVIPEVFQRDIEPSLRPGAAVVFSSGYVLAHQLVEPPPGVDVLLLAPRMVGGNVRSAYERGTGFMSYVGVEADATGKALPRLLALADAVGSLQRGALELTARQEATLDLFIEQTVGTCLGAAFQLAFALGTEAGVPAEALVCELYMSGEMAQTIQTMADVGFLASVTGHGAAAAYGGFLATAELPLAELERFFRDRLQFVRSGGFAQALHKELADGYPTIRLIESLAGQDNPLSLAERRLRAALSGAEAAAPDRTPD